MAFKFRLERVLSVRTVLEEQAKLEWGAQERLLQEEQRCLIRLNAQKQEIRAFGYGQSDIRLRQAMYTYLEVLEERIELQLERIRAQEEATAAAKEAWIEAHRETEKITTLRDQEHALFVRDEQRKEQKTLDEMRPRMGW